MKNWRFAVVINPFEHHAMIEKNKEERA